MSKDGLNYCKMCRIRLAKFNSMLCTHCTKQHGQGTRMKYRVHQKIQLPNCTQCRIRQTGNAAGVCTRCLNSLLRLEK